MATLTGAVAVAVAAADGVRSDLFARIDALDAMIGGNRAGELVNGLAGLRRIAAANGIAPAVTVIRALDAALARGERGPRVHGGLAILRDAVGCGASDARACETFAAVCSLRLGG